MSALFISLLTLVLILISVFVVFLVLMQKSQSGGMGSAFGGGMAESAFGSDTSNVLTKATIYTSIAFFTIALILYLMYQSSASDQEIGLDVEAITTIIEEAVVEDSEESTAE
ncbi:MAG: preprotein translocase subunit SecG [Opitutae bacterium]|jgi:preprotein translocase subunit SecG|nr:preprotein translocase subunit SecG [Opitutae bacterium]